MDQFDLDILALLRENARITHSDLSQRIHLSVPAVSERVRKLEQHGYIKKFTALISAKKFGKTLVFFTNVSLAHPRFVDGFLESVNSMPEILECHHVAGEGDYLLKTVTDDTVAMERIIHRLRCIEGVQRTKTTVVLSTVKEEPCIRVAGK